MGVSQQACSTHQFVVFSTALEEGAPSVLDVARKSGKASESAATSSEGADSLKARLMAGQTVDKTPGVVVESVPALDNPGCLPGGGFAPGASNVEAVPDPFPRNAPTRHPNTGSSTVDKSKNLAKIRRK